jgi:acyl-CoA thioesterase I
LSSIRLVCAAAAIAALIGVAAVAVPTRAATVSPACTAPDDLTRLDESITSTAALLSERRALRIVAFGSSSTAGIGASSPANSYPARLQAELHELFPEMDISVLNRGISGEDAREMVARLDTSVIAERPDLVLWQVGTNAIVRDEKLEEEASRVRLGIDRLKTAGSEVILVDPQYAPKVIGKPHAAAMVQMLETVARRAHVAVFHRFAIMGYWQRMQGLPFEQFTSRDGLHMNDWSYGCISKLLAGAIVESASRPTAVQSIARSL